MLVKDYRLIDFGYASAEQEGARAPGLLLRGYFDLNHVCEQALKGSEFLILGYKGSGKTAIAERLKLLYENDSQVFINDINLEDFPYASFSQLIPGNVAPEAKYPTAWSWLLLIHLIASLAKDASLKPRDPEELVATLEALRDMGLLPASGLSHIVRTTTKKTFKLTIPKVFERTVETTDTLVDIPHFVDNLKRLVTRLHTENKHLLILDGLDEIVTNEAAQWDSLGALIFEVNRLNALFNKNNIPAKIMVLCRTDIFELLRGANKNKIRQDSAIELNWYADPPIKSLLVRIANLRAALAFDQETDLFTEFFPKKIFRRGSLRIFLDTTRHTPRDFLQLLKYIQSNCAETKPSIKAVRAGLRQYSVEYFLPEIIDELEGYASAAEVKEFFQIVGSLRSRDFSAKQLYDAVDSDSLLAKDMVDRILRALFECSAVGNIQHRSGGARFLTFRFRNRHATFNLKERILLHRGLWRALNLPVDPSWEYGL